MKTNEERLQDLFFLSGNLSHVKADEIPDIDLYMDQSYHLHGQPFKKI